MNQRKRPEVVSNLKLRIPLGRGMDSVACILCSSAVSSEYRWSTVRLLFGPATFLKQKSMEPLTRGDCVVVDLTHRFGWWVIPVLLLSFVGTTSTLHCRRAFS